MKKLLHERAREFAEASWDGVIGSIGKDSDAPIILDRDSATNLANEVETDYQPKPRDTEGNSVHEGMEVEGGTVFTWRIFSDGSWDLLNSSFEVIQSGGCDDPIRLPPPISLDANGKPTRKGDKVWDIRIEMKDNPFWGRQLTVVEVTEAGIVVAPSLESGATMSAPAHHFSHERPQFDRQGIRCAPGDIVFGLGREQHRYKVLSEELDVEKCEPYDHGRFTLPCLDLTEGDESVCFLDPSMVSHKEPESYEELQGMLHKEGSEEDSYEKLRDEMRATEGPVGTITAGKWADRLTALMERDQNMVNNHSIIIDRTKLDSPHLMILGRPIASDRKCSFALQELKQGKISLEDLLNTQDECLRRIKIYDLLRVYKGIENSKARKIMKELHIAETRRIADLDKLQHIALLDFIQERDL